MKEKVIAIFDVGKTNKKLLLFDYNLNLVLEQEIRFPEKLDDDGFECDNIELIEKWIKESITKLVHSEKYDLTALNFATYGATIVYLDAEGQRITPVYNYLKPIDEKIPERLYRRYGGRMNSAGELHLRHWVCLIQEYRYYGSNLSNLKYSQK